MPEKNDANVPSDQDFLDFASEQLRKAEKKNDVVKEHYGIAVGQAIRKRWLRNNKEIKPNTNQVIMGEKVLTFKDPAHKDKKDKFEERMREVLIKKLSCSVVTEEVETLENWLDQEDNKERLAKAGPKSYMSNFRRFLQDTDAKGIYSECESCIKKKKWGRFFLGKASKDISLMRQVRTIIGPKYPNNTEIDINFGFNSSTIILDRNKPLDIASLRRIQSFLDEKNYNEAIELINNIIKKEKRLKFFSFKESTINRHMQNIHQLERIAKKCENIEASRVVISRLDIEQLYRVYTEDSPQNIANRHRIHAIKKLANDPSHQTRNLGLKIGADNELKKKFEFFTYLSLSSNSDSINLRKNRIGLSDVLVKLEQNNLDRKLYQPVIKNIVKYSENTAFVKKAFKLLDKGNKVAVLAEASEEKRGIIYGTLGREARNLLQPQVDEKIKAISESGNSERSPMKTR